MKRIIIAAAAVLLALNVSAQNSLEINAAIPMGDVAMKSINKNEVTLNNAKTHNGLLVMFSCNTCPYVIKSQARTKEVMAYAKQKGIGMVIVNSNEAQRDEEDSYNAMVKYAKAQGYNVPYVLDEKSKLADAFGATRTPEVYLFDGNGKLMYKGAMEDNPANPAESKEMFLKNAIDKMTMGIMPDPGSTRSVGCSIKRQS